MKINALRCFFPYALVLLFLFNIPFLSNAQANIDFGKSYINVTKGVSGGTVEPGDLLEIRASLVVKSGTYDSCAFFDVLPTGTSYISNTIRILTNEGKIYKQFTDAANDDEGSIAGSNIRINLGFNQSSAPATAFRRGRVANTHKPSFYGSTCIMIASYRVQVTAFYGATISIGGGSISYKPSGSVLATINFPARTIAVFKNYGICTNTVGTNSLGTEFNGTFGSGKPRNRGTSANVPMGYTYATFTSNSPQDYYYGVANNTSINTGYTTSNTWPKPDAAHRVFGVWDVIGDHTGASNPLTGNAAADTVNNNNGGYMLVINAAYRIDSAFQQTISGLCPNTYYEISCWVRNICSRCGCDSNGVGASGAGYIPTAANDSSGVYPNLSFNVNGIDYYTTGNLQYTGQWVKKGFTFLTGTTQTSFTLKFFNNAPGGGGNDWALDDISVATCSPDLTFTPSNNPTICKGNTISIGCIIKSYFPNYTNYKWQKSTDNGTTWNDLTTPAVGTPTWTGSDWQYSVSYPTFVANASDSGNKYRIVVATTAANLSDPNCSISLTTSIITLSVIDCSMPLATNFLSVNGVRQSGFNKIYWSTSEETNPAVYIVERSNDGRNYNPIGSIHQSNNNRYEWIDSFPVAKNYYRVKMVGDNSSYKYSRVILLSKEMSTKLNVQNPFNDKLLFEVETPFDISVPAYLSDITGRIILKKQLNLNQGTQQFLLTETTTLPIGTYYLQLQVGSELITKKVLKTF
ncbi:MAG: hypothetical protein C4330_03985 [Chitinophagaceae bacterium]